MSSRQIISSHQEEPKPKTAKPPEAVAGSGFVLRGQLSTAAPDHVLPEGVLLRVSVGGDPGEGTGFSLEPDPAGGFHIELSEEEIRHGFRFSAVGGDGQVLFSKEWEEPPAAGESPHFEEIVLEGSPEGWGRPGAEPDDVIGPAWKRTIEAALGRFSGDEARRLHAAAGEIADRAVAPLQALLPAARRLLDGDLTALATLNALAEQLYDEHVEDRDRIEEALSAYEGELENLDPEARAALAEVPPAGGLLSASAYQEVGAALLGSHDDEGIRQQRMVLFQALTDRALGRMRPLHAAAAAAAGGRPEARQAFASRMGWDVPVPRDPPPTAGGGFEPFEVGSTIVGYTPAPDGDPWDTGDPWGVFRELTREKTQVKELFEDGLAAIGRAERYSNTLALRKLGPGALGTGQAYSIREIVAKSDRQKGPFLAGETVLIRGKGFGGGSENAVVLASSDLPGGQLVLPATGTHVKSWSDTEVELELPSRQVRGGLSLRITVRTVNLPHSPVRSVNKIGAPFPLSSVTPKTEISYLRHLGGPPAAKDAANLLALIEAGGRRVRTDYAQVSWKTTYLSSVRIVHQPPNGASLPIDARGKTSGGFKFPALLDRRQDGTHKFHVEGSFRNRTFRSKPIALEIVNGERPAIRSFLINGKKEAVAKDGDSVTLSWDVAGAKKLRLDQLTYLSQRASHPLSATPQASKITLAGAQLQAENGNVTLVATGSPERLGDLVKVSEKRHLEYEPFIVDFSVEPAKPAFTPGEKLKLKYRVKHAREVLVKKKGQNRGVWSRSLKKSGDLEGVTSEQQMPGATTTWVLVAANRAPKPAEKDLALKIAAKIEQFELCARGAAYVSPGRQSTSQPTPCAQSIDLGWEANGHGSCFQKADLRFKAVGWKELIFTGPGLRKVYTRGQQVFTPVLPIPKSDRPGDSVTVTLTAKGDGGAEATKTVTANYKHAVKQWKYVATLKSFPKPPQTNPKPPPPTISGQVSARTEAQATAEARKRLAAQAQNIEKLEVKEI